jgi:hypothetical protein
MATDNPVTPSLQCAVREHRGGVFSISQALRYSPQKPWREGAHDISYRHPIWHLRSHAVRTWPKHRSTIYI